MLTCHLSIHLEKKISFSKGVCSERTLGNEKTSTCPETLELKFRVGGLLIQTLIELILVFDRIDFCRSKRPSIELTCIRCGEVMEPADNTEGVKKKFLDTIFSANSGPSNLY